LILGNEVAGRSGLLSYILSGGSHAYSAARRREMKVTMTSRGYQSVRFVDQAGNRGIAEQSSAIDAGNPTRDQPGSSYLLLGREDSPVQLNIDQVGELVEYLERWLEEGKLVASVPGACAESA
jgi:hypothetical protein